MLENLLGSALMEREAERERVRCMAGDSQELADGRDVRLAVGAIEAFRDVEHKVGPEQSEAGREAAVGLEPMDLADSTESALHRIDGGGLIPLGVKVRLMEICSESPVVASGRGRGFGVRPGWVSRRRWFEIEGESYPNCQRLPLQKRPSARDEPRRVQKSTQLR
jgi:hypothetical protein